MTTQLADRVMKARRESVCIRCGRPIRVGDQIARVGRQWQHVDHILKRIRRQLKHETGGR